MLRQPINEVILAAMSFVCDHNDVAPIREQRKCIAALLWHEFLNGREDHAAGRHPQKLAQVSSALSLLWFLAQQFLATAEGAE